MKALTVRQPYASLISLGVKTIETRTKPTKYRGPLLIHAGKSIDHYVSEGFDSVWHEHGFCFTDSHRFPLGAIVASCKLVDCVPILAQEDELKVAWQRHVAPIYDGALWLWNGPSKDLARSTGRPSWLHDDITDQRPYGDFTPGRYAWLLEDIQPVEKRCPACWDRAIKSPNGKSYYADCLTCENGVCQPIPAKGNQGLWNWTP